MKNLQTYKHSLVLAMLLLCVGFANAQKTYKETFTVGEDALVSVNTSHTNVVFETWNKDKVEVEAYVEGDDLSEQEKQQIFDAWKFDVLGNSKKVVITSNEGNLWVGLDHMGDFPALPNMDKMVNLSDLQSLEGLASLGDVFSDLNVVIPEMPEMEKMPIWPFSEERPSFRYGDAYSNYNFSNNGAYVFDRNEYEEDKNGYVKRLNKKYGSNVSVAETDRWLKEVDAWGENFEKRMEAWGEDFGTRFNKNFGPEFEKKMEKWGENFGKRFEKDMEEWGENFGKRMEKWGARFEKEAEEWAKQFDDGNYSKETIIDENGNKTTIIQSGGSGNVFFKKPGKKAKKTIIIRMPKNTKTDINVRHGEIKMADVTNVRASLNYAAFTANSIDGGKTLINAAYAPVSVNYWGDGVLAVQYVDDCNLNEVATINLQANSSNVNINEIKNDAYIQGTIGNLFISKVAPDFTSIAIVLDDTDAKIELPMSSNFNIFFSGRKSTLQYPKSLQVQQSKEYGQVLVKGFNKKRNENRKLTINADFSNIRLQ